MNSKFNLWTITFIASNGVHSHIECMEKDEVIYELKELEANGQNMEYVNIYPPKTNITIDELEKY